MPRKVEQMMERQEKRAQAGAFAQVNPAGVAFPMNPGTGTNIMYSQGTSPATYTSASSIPVAG